jgi:hypothetical protein
LNYPVDLTDLSFPFLIVSLFQAIQEKIEEYNRMDVDLADEDEQNSAYMITDRLEKQYV